MSIWSYVNAAGWALVVLMLTMMIRDFIRVERSMKEKEATENV